ncbi:SDR family NAD(P)-dependent oxidoreductase [Dactylosporangium sp. CA-092794]|uniref:SDR family NAD(P)-dependent oxidoreductase n=1 Tax=Dactylosporangium sp. CA-092794 TaxID=3239929 RepID=UPI003D8E35CB
MKELDGKVAVVTGAGSGLGRAMAHAFAAEGMVVVVADRRLDAAEQVAGEIRAEDGRAQAMEVDVTDLRSTEALADRVDQELGGAQLLVNNAGVMPTTPLLMTDELSWRWIVEVNLLGVVHGIQVFVPRMLRSGRDGHVVNTASIAGMVAGAGNRANRVLLGDRGFPESPGMMHGYTATKYAVVGLTEALSAELAWTRVGVSLLCPHGHESTNISRNSAKYRPAAFGGPSDPEALNDTIRRTNWAAAQPERPTMVPKQPEELARRVVRAIRAGHFYVFTHATDRWAIEERSEQIRAGLDDADGFAP